MCGICGILYKDSDASVVKRTDLKKMTDTFIHRGPDAEGYYINQNQKTGFGFRRLSIIDLKTGDQPISNEDKTVWVVCNGEIYNFRYLRSLLEKKGHVFHTQTDIETIVHAYEEFGVNFPGYLRGMFSIAIWDQNNKKLILCRDRIGKKPMFYSLHGNAFYFSSEIKAFLKLNGTPHGISQEALSFYLSIGYIPAPWSIIEGINKLPPAHCLALNTDTMQKNIFQYWDIEYKPKLEISEPDAIDEFSKILKESVQLRLVSDVPLGALLSGGIDSSIIVSLMSELSGKSVDTFTIGFQEADFDERRYAKMISERYGTNHHEFVVKPEATEVLPKLAYFLDEPIADPSVLPTYYVSEMAKRNVTVVLNGDGGDEDFGGYWHHASALRLYRYHSVGRFLNNSWINRVEEYLSENAPTQYGRRIFRFMSQLHWPLWKIHQYRIRFFDVAMQDKLLKEKSLKFLPDQVFQTIYSDVPPLEPTDALLNADMHSVMPGQFLVKMDRMTMAHALEARSPLLDHKVIEFAARLDTRYKIRGTQQKYLLRKIAEKYLPPDLLKRKKMGFAVPLNRWKDERFDSFTKDMLLSGHSRIKDYLRINPVNEIIIKAKSKDAIACGQLWSLLILELWFREVYGS